MKEIKLKKQVLFFMLFAKLLLIAYIWLSRNSGGFSTDQAVGAVTLITPLFAVYLAAIYREFATLKSDEKEQQQTDKVSKTYRNITYITLTVYFFAILGAVTLKANGTFNFNQFQSMLTAVESGFGAYVGQIVFSLFGKKTETNVA